MWRCVCWGFASSAFGLKPVGDSARGAHREGVQCLKETYTAAVGNLIEAKSHIYWTFLNSCEITVLGRCYVFRRFTTFQPYILPMCGTPRWVLHSVWGMSTLNPAPAAAAECRAPDSCYAVMSRRTCLPELESCRVLGY